MGFGNFIPFEPKRIVLLTFGLLRERGRGVTVTCRKCGHARFLDPKSMRYLAERLADDRRLEDAEDLFRCSRCNYDRVRLTPEKEHGGARFTKGGPLS
jgi:ribosomal protein L40E